MAEWGLSIEGLDELRRELNKAQRGMGRTVNKALKTGLTRHTLPAARRAYGTLSHVPGRGRSGIAVFATNRGAGVALRPGKYPWLAGAEFGSRRYKQFFPWVGNQYTGGDFPGYFVGPAIKATIGKVEDDMLDDLVDLLEGKP